MTLQKSPPLKRRATITRYQLSDCCSPGLQTRGFSPFVSNAPKVAVEETAESAVSCWDAVSNEMRP